MVKGAVISNRPVFAGVVEGRERSVVRNEAQAVGRGV